MDHTQPCAAAPYPAVSIPTNTAMIIPFPNIFVALQCLNGQSYLSSLPLSSTYTVRQPNGADFIQNIRTCYRRMAIDDRHEAWLSRWSTKTIVGTAMVQQILPPSPTAKCSCYRVYLSDFEYDWLLTEAYRNPSSLQAEHIRYTSLAITSNTSTNSINNTTLNNNRVITLQKVLDKNSIAAVLITLLITSPGLGTLVGHLSDSAEAGIAAGAAVFALATFLQLLTAWILG